MLKKQGTRVGLVRFNIGFLESSARAVRTAIRRKVDISRVWPRACESVSSVWAFSAGERLPRARGAGGPTIFGAHEPTRLTSDTAAAIGEIRTRLAAALYRFACVRTDCTKADRASLDANTG